MALLSGIRLLNLGFSLRLPLLNKPPFIGLQGNLVTIKAWNNDQLSENTIASINIPNEVFSKMKFSVHSNQDGGEEVILVSVGYRESKLFSRLNKSHAG